MLENEKAKLILDFAYRVRNTNEVRRPDLILEKKEEKVTLFYAIWISSLYNQCFLKVFILRSTQFEIICRTKFLKLTQSMSPRYN